tara:strand:- start:75 stop:350 length:276 start_codon:yes stop_codon:yes gene_type:complete
MNSKRHAEESKRFSRLTYVRKPREDHVYLVEYTKDEPEQSVQNYFSRKTVVIFNLIEVFDSKELAQQERALLQSRGYKAWIRVLPIVRAAK